MKLANSSNQYCSRQFNCWQNWAVRILQHLALLVILTFTQQSFAGHQSLPSYPPVSLSEFQGQNISHLLNLYEIESTQPRGINYHTAGLQNNKPLTVVNRDTGQYIGIINLYNDTGQSDWAIDVHGTVIDNITASLFTGGATQQKSHSYGKQSVLPMSNALFFEIPPGEMAKLVIEVRSKVFFSEPRLFVTPSLEYQTQAQLYYAIVLAAFGALFALSIYNLFIFIGSRETPHLLYAMYLSVYMAAWFFDFKLGVQFFGLTDYRYHFIPFLLVPIFGGLFCTRFLQLNIKTSLCAKIFALNSLVCILFLPFTVYLYEYNRDVASITIVIWVFTAFGAGLKKIVDGYRPARYFSVAFLCLLLPLTIMIAKNQGLVFHPNLNVELISLIGGVLDAILLAFALADRNSLIAESNYRLRQNLKKEVAAQTEQLSLTNRQLAAANDELKQADDAKNQFLATVSHEIRTPMTSIIGFSEALQSGDVPREQHRKVFTSITNSGRHLLRIINDILDISKIQENRLEFEYLQIDLIKLFNDMCATAEQSAIDKGIGFSGRFQYPIPVKLYADPTRLRQILQNILSNALKFTRHGDVELLISSTSDTVTFEVKDSGIGLSEKEKELIFTPFSQADASITRRFGGSGLGLSISRQLAQGMGGDVTVQSEKGVGSIFTVTIPLTEQCKLHMLYSEHELMVHNTHDTVEPETDDSQKIFKQKRVLVADDQPDNVALVKLLLERMNVNVDVAYDGEEALFKAKIAEPYDLILMDISMPIINGIEAIKQIKANNIHSPVIAFTAHDVSQQKNDYLSLGFCDCIAKPLERASFVETITEHLNHDDTGDDNVIEEATMANLRINYISSLKQDLDKLRVAQAIGDYHSIKSIAHRIKGSASCFGLPDMSQRFSVIEKQYDSPQDDHALLESAMRLIEKL